MAEGVGLAISNYWRVLTVPWEMFAGDNSKLLEELCLHGKHRVHSPPSVIRQTALVISGQIALLQEGGKLSTSQSPSAAKVQLLKSTQQGQHSSEKGVLALATLRQGDVQK